MFICMMPTDENVPILICPLLEMSHEEMSYKLFIEIFIILRDISFITIRYKRLLKFI